MYNVWREVYPRISSQHHNATKPGELASSSYPVDRREQMEPELVYSSQSYPIACPIGTPCGECIGILPDTIRCAEKEKKNWKDNIIWS